MPSQDNTVSIVIAGQQITGWQSVRITRGAERCPSDFDLSLTERFPANASQVDIQPGQPCEVWVGTDRLVTGYVDRYGASVSPSEHTIRVQGRGKCEDLVDCSAYVPGGQLTKANLVDFATALAAPFGITVSSLTGDKVPVTQPNGSPITLNVMLGETPYELVERVARYAGVLVYDGTDGNLILAQKGAVQMASGFSQGVNVQGAAVTFSMDERFSVYKAAIMSQDTFIQIPGDAGPFIGQAVDPAVGTDTPQPPQRYRPRIIVSEQATYGQFLATQRATWEMQRRRGRSQAVQLTCDSWRDQAGTLWQPNALASVSLPALKLDNVQWVISEVTFLRDAERGTTADLVLMPPEAFTPEPSTLQLYDWQVANALPGGAAQTPSGAAEAAGVR